MRKSKKGFILLGITTSIIAANGIMQAVKPLKMNISEKSILEYNHNPETALDNIFIEDGMTILPFIFKTPTEKLTETKIREEFEKCGLTIESISTGNEVGTGTEIIANGNKYTVLVYGDVNGDGEVDIYDAMRIIRAMKQTTESNLNGIYFKAGNVSNDDNIIDIYDAMREISFMKRIQKKLVLVEPISIKESRTLTKITATYNNTTPVSAATTLDQIKQNIEVKAHYSNGDIETVAEFELTGTLVAGQTNTLTITFGGQTANITVTVAERELTGITASYDNTTPVPATTTLEELKSKITVTGTYNNNTTGTITDFTLAGNLEPGETNTITVKAQGQEYEITVTVEAASVESIALEKAPDKNKYNYGEKELDLTGGKIIVNWTVGNPTSLDLSNAKVTGYDPKQEGEQTLTVTYAGTETTFKVTVLDKISALELTNTGRTSNVTAVSGGYRTNSKSEFALGTIQAVNKDNVSALDPNMITLSKELVSSDDADATEESLTIEKVIDENGNVILKGKTTTAGTYKIIVTLTYEGETPINLEINLVAEKSTILGRVEAKTDIDELKVGHPIEANIFVYNENGEPIVPETIEVEDVPGITITKLDEYGAITTDSSRVKAIRISTTLETAQKVTFTIKAKGTGANNEVSTEVSLQVKDAPVLTSVTMDETDISLYTEEKENTKVDGVNIYTVFGVDFLDQLGETIEYAPSNLKIVNEDDLEYLSMQKGQAAIVVPNVLIKKTGGTAQKQGVGLDVKFYDESGKDATTVVKQLGVAYKKDLEGREVVLSSIPGKKIKIIDYNKNVIKEIPLNVVLKELTILRISEDGRQNITKDSTTGAYVTQLNQEFIIGTITVGTDEGPLTPEMLTTELEGNTDGITITYEYNDANQIIIKGTITEVGEYKITPKAGDIKVINPIILEAKEIPTIPTVLNVELSKETVEIGKATISNLKVITDLNPNGEQVLVRDITLSYDTNKIDVKYLSATSGFETDKALDEVSGLKITAKTTEDTEVDLTMTLFAGKENEKTITTKISVYNSVPRYIEVDDSVALSKSDYNAVAIRAYADAEKKKPVTLTYDMFEVNPMEGTTEVADKIYITIPSVLISNGTKEKEREIILNNFQDKDNNIISSSGNKEITYIGFTVEVPDGFTVEDTALNGVTITLKSTATGGETKTITTTYTAP